MKGEEEPRVENIVIKQQSRARQAQVEAEGNLQRCPSYLREFRNWQLQRLDSRQKTGGKGTLNNQDILCLLNNYSKGDKDVKHTHTVLCP